MKSGRGGSRGGRSRRIAWARITLAPLLLVGGACDAAEPITVGSVTDPPTASGGASCDAFVPPNGVARCNACGDEPAECGPNGCDDGRWCEASTATCVSPVTLTACPHTVPLGCVETNGESGCCGEDGHLYFCEEGDAYPLSAACLAGTCGWDESSRRYACGTAGTADPDGAIVRRCPLAP